MKSKMVGLGNKNSKRDAIFILSSHFKIQFFNQIARVIRPIARCSSIASIG
jgi:hypothetical protein